MAENFTRPSRPVFGIPRYDRAHRFLAIRRQAGRPCSNFREASSSQYRGAAGEGKMNDPKKGLSSLGLDNAIRLRWALRDIKANRLKFSPVAPNDLRILIDMGYVEMKNDTPVVTPAGLDQMEI